MDARALLLGALTAAAAWLVARHFVTPPRPRPLAPPRRAARPPRDPRRHDDRAPAAWLARPGRWRTSGAVLSAEAAAARAAELRRQGFQGWWVRAPDGRARLVGRASGPLEPAPGWTTWEVGDPLQ